MYGERLIRIVTLSLGTLTHLFFFTGVPLAYGTTKVPSTYLTNKTVEGVCSDHNGLCSVL